MKQLIMKPLFTEIEYENAKSQDKLPLECYTCGKTFYVLKKEITRVLKHNLQWCKYCSQKCHQEKNKKGIKTNCKHCGKEIYIPQREIRKNKNNNYFCSRSCSAIYNNSHKTKGVRVSKLEIFLQEKLLLSYPDIKFLFNDKTAINSELDIFIPQFNLAFELNGIFHYKPIYGKKKLKQIQNNDRIKIKLCKNSNIDLHIIDTTLQHNFNQETSQVYWEYIKNLIDSKLTMCCETQ